MGRFKKAIAKDRVTVVDFGASWCGPCKRIAPAFEALSEKYTDVKFMSVDVDDRDDLSDRYNISAVPTFILFRQGKVLSQVSGANISKVEEMIKEYR